jgi:hypothetical protein
MLKTLVSCKTDNSIVAVWSSVFGNLLRLCRVEEICTDEDENEVIVILRACEEESGRHDSFALFLNEIDRLGLFSKAMQT